MDIFRIEPLWGAGVEQLLGAVIFLLIFFAQMIKAYFDAQTAKEEGKKLKSQAATDEPKDEFILQPKPQRERKRPPRKQLVLNETVSEDNNRKVRKALSRELAPQGEGTRFEAVPGTFDEKQIVASSIEPTVKPMLESMTGIYEASPTSAEAQPQPLTLDIQKLIARPEGIRQAIILAEILKRPNY